MNRPTSISVTHLPRAEPNTAIARVLSLPLVTFLIYEAAEEHNQTDGVAAVRFEWATHHTEGGPNDEAFHHHPLAPFVTDEPFVEIVDSPWLVEYCRMADKDGDSAWIRRRGLHHYFLTFKENCFECFAKSCDPVGVFNTVPEAIQACLQSATRL